MFLYDEESERSLLHIWRFVHPGRCGVHAPYKPYGVFLFKGRYILIGNIDKNCFIKYYGVGNVFYVTYRNRPIAVETDSDNLDKYGIGIYDFYQ